MKDDYFVKCFHSLTIFFDSLDSENKILLAMLAILEKEKISNDRGSSFGAVQTDLSLVI